MEQSPSEGNNFPASQNNFLHVTAEGSLPHSREPTTCLYTPTDESSP
jgi:hypothetical protein